jgi:hypothetical protein
MAAEATSIDNSQLIASRREEVISSYHAAIARNKRQYHEKDDKATSEYIYPNQVEDAVAIVNEFTQKGRRVVSITKKTKVGMDGLMIEVVTRMTTHPDDAFAVNPANVRIITGMSNAKWEKDMKSKSPECFKDKIFHHGQLHNADLLELKNGFIIIDELDSGDKECQVLHNTLKEAGVLNIEYMERHNIRFMFASATMIKELYDLYKWGTYHMLYKMTIPVDYIGHSDFLERGIIQEFYEMTPEHADKWIQEDILDNYGVEYRVHIARVNLKTGSNLQNACIRKGITFLNHTSDEPITDKELDTLFKDPLSTHVVLGVKGFFRRANLIPNNWKLRIGATHELYTKIPDNNVQIQGLPGRMTGYWRHILDAGHNTGPHRTSIKAVEEYEETYNDPFGKNSYQSAGFRKKNGRVRAEPTMVSAKNVMGLEAAAAADDKPKYDYRIFDSFQTAQKYCKLLGYQGKWTDLDKKDEFYLAGLNAKKAIASLEDACKKVQSGYGGGGAKRTYFPCYVNTEDHTTLRIVVIIRPETISEKIKLGIADAAFPSM